MGRRHQWITVLDRTPKHIRMSETFKQLILLACAAGILTIVDVSNYTEI